MKPKKVSLIIFLLAIVFCCGIKLSSKAQSIQPIEVTYISNCGFLLQVGDKKILFDPESPDQAFEKDAVSDVYKKIIQGVSPFDNLTAILISHSHKDHLAAYAVADIIQKQKVRLYTNTGVFEDIQKAVPEKFDEIKSFIEVIEPYETGIIRKEIGGINVDFLGLYHAGAPNYIFKDLSFVLSFSGLNIFYMSDIDPGYADNLEVIKKWARQDKKIDLLFSPDVNLYPNQWSEKGAEIIKTYIKPEHIIATHLDPKAIDEAEKKVLENFPGAMVFRKCNEKKIIK